MRILCTFPGKFGDLLWALPTIRAISRRIGEPVDLLTSREMASITPLLAQQAYIGAVGASPLWADADCAPVERRMPPPVLVDEIQRTENYDRVLHLGYTDWPKRPLPFEVLDTFHQSGYGVTWGTNYQIQDAELDLGTPWITLPPSPHWGTYRWPWLFGFSDEHFELKYGLVTLLEAQYRRLVHSPGLVNRVNTQRLPATSIGTSPRWTAEAGQSPTTWEDSVQLLQRTSVLLACNSALHVLAVACGVPVVMMEPSPARHNPIFYPLGTLGPEVTLVTGTDGQPTFDARHVRDVLEAAVARAQLAQVDSAPSPSER